MAYQFKSFQELFEAYANVNSTNLLNVSAKALLTIQIPVTPAHTAELDAQNLVIGNFIKQVDTLFSSLSVGERPQVNAFIALFADPKNHAVISNPEHSDYDNLANSIPGKAKKLFNFLQMATVAEALVPLAAEVDRQIAKFIQLGLQDVNGAPKSVALTTLIPAIPATSDLPPLSETQDLTTAAPVLLSGGPGNGSTQKTDPISPPKTPTRHTASETPNRLQRSLSVGNISTDSPMRPGVTRFKLNQVGVFY